MKFPAPVSIAWLATFLDAKVEGNLNDSATGINEIHKVEIGDLVFVDHPKYYSTCLNSAASFIIINQSVEVPDGKALLIVAEPFEAYQKIVAYFAPVVPQDNMISASAKIAATALVYPNVFIGHNVTVGEHAVIHPGVVIRDNAVIGNNVVIQSGTVIGSDAFYYNTKKSREQWYKRMNSCGRVVIADGVEIGAGCTIDRGVSHETYIGAGTKIDNMVHIGHDTTIGKNCLFAAQVGIAGASVIEDGVVLWGQVGVSKTLTIGESAVVLAQSGVPSSLKGGQVYFGTPAENALSKKKELVWVKRIPALWKQVQEGLGVK